MTACCRWFRNPARKPPVILWKPYEKWNILHINWCRISSIDISTVWHQSLILDLFLFRWIFYGFYHGINHHEFHRHWGNMFYHVQPEKKQMWVHIVGWSKCKGPLGGLIFLGGRGWESLNFAGHMHRFGWNMPFLWAWMFPRVWKKSWRLYASWIGSGEGGMGWKKLQPGHGLGWCHVIPPVSSNSCFVNAYQLGFHGLWRSYYLVPWHIHPFF